MEKLVLARYNAEALRSGKKLKTSWRKDWVEGWYQTALTELLAGRRLDEVIEVLDWLFTSCGGDLPSAVIQDPDAYLSAKQVAFYRVHGGVPRDFKRKVTNLREVFCHLDQLVTLMRAPHDPNSGFTTLRSAMEKSQLLRSHRKVADPEPSLSPQAVASLAQVRVALFGHRDHWAPPPPHCTGYRPPRPPATDVATDMGSMSNIEERRARYAARAAAQHRETA
jgi:hypothetical protein